MLKKLSLVAAVIVAVLAFTGASRADVITIWGQFDGGAITPLGSGSGTAAFSGLFGAFNVDVAGTGTPLLPQPDLQTSSLDATSSGGAHTLTIWVTEQNITSPTGINQFLSGFTNNNFTGDAGSITESTLIDVLNGVHSGTTLATTTFTAQNKLDVFANTPSLPNPFSETAMYTFTTTGIGGNPGGSVNATIDISGPVPEPSSIALLGTGLFGLAGLVRRRVGSK